MTNTQQMELGFERSMRVASPHTQEHKSKAQWWFAQMRRVVAMTVEWQPTQNGRAEQIYLNMTVKKF